jgi:RNA polymerase sigma-70 factor (ECF subfamily)
MVDENVLRAEPKPVAPAQLELVSDADRLFRSRLEASIDAGYRLAAVILGDRREAEDVAHDAAERAWRARASLRRADSFEAWFQRIIVNACRDRMRRRRSMPSFVSVDAAGEAVLGSSASTLDPFSASLQRDALVRALALLGPEQRIVIVLRFYLDLEIDEIARRLGARSGTVKSRLHRGLKELRAGWDAAQRQEEAAER